MIIMIIFKGYGNDRNTQPTFNQFKYGGAMNRSVRDLRAKPCIRTDIQDLLIIHPAMFVWIKNERFF